ncbi:Uncharacterised protein [Mycobacteroides abscessus subsp. abscessus]|uniref:hypothetical protein n=1 Tax=Mycobacteroides abscessus TaxID=36809 RepID=UPI0009268EC3|nr:hypothetical protein [Mycobacteroides abscessus]SIH24553.1 Uncharacterised protein [Mycobacteroides abscessus subsp. abscessus]
MTTTTTASADVLNRLGLVTVTTYAEPHIIDGHHFYDDQCAVIGAALEGDHFPTVVFHYSGREATVHICTTGKVAPYNGNGIDTLLVSEDVDGCLFDARMYASSGQADYASRVLTLLLPHLQDLPSDVSDEVESLIALLTDRAARQVWCVRDEKDGRVVHAYVQECSPSEFDLVVIDYDDAEHGRYLAALGDSEDDNFTAQGEERLKQHRVLESDIPSDVEIVGCHWPRHLQAHGIVATQLFAMDR